MKTAAIFSATDQLGPSIEQFLPASQGLRMDHLVLASNELTLVLASSRTDTCCPVCQEPSKRVHSRYQRICLGATCACNSICWSIAFSVITHAVFVRSLQNAS